MLYMVSEAVVFIGHPHHTHMCLEEAYIQPYTVTVVATITTLNNIK